MTPRIRTSLLAFTLATLFASLPAQAQDAVQTELQILRKLVEDQSKKLDSLAAQMARLTAMVGEKTAITPAATSAAAPTHAHDPGEFSAAPAAKPVALENAAIHIVVKGESLDKIAKQHGTTVAELQKLNKITDPKKLQIGQQLMLPASAQKPAEH